MTSIKLICSILVSLMLLGKPVFGMDPNCEGAISNALNFEALVRFFAPSLENHVGYSEFSKTGKIRLVKSLLGPLNSTTGKRETLSQELEINDIGKLSIALGKQYYDSKNPAQSIKVHATQAYGIFKKAIVASVWHKFNGSKSDYENAILNTIQDWKRTQDTLGRTRGREAHIEEVQALLKDDIEAHQLAPQILTLKVSRSQDNYFANVTFIKDPTLQKIVLVEFEERFLLDDDFVDVSTGSFDFTD